MEWFKAISQQITGLVWPAVVLVVVLIFRREIRSLLRGVKEVKYPGGSITVEVAKLEARVEKAGAVTERVAGSHVIEESFVGSNVRAELTISQLRPELEKELFRLSWTTLSHNDVKGWSTGRQIDELQNSEVLGGEFADSLRAFLRISDDVARGADIANEVKLRLTGVGISLMAQLHFQRKVLEMVRDFEGHGLWHMHMHLDGETRKYYFWSAVAASLPGFEFNYDIYRESAERHNEKTIASHPEERAMPRHTVYVLPLGEFVQVLEFREKELLRLIAVWHNAQADAWEAFQKANEWQWPSEWGHLGWSGPIIRDRLSLYSAEDDLMQTRNALNRYRRRLLVSPEGGLQNGG